MYCYFPLPHFLARLTSSSRLSSSCLRMCLLKCGLKSASQHKYRLIYQYVKEDQTKELMNHASRVHATIEEKNAELSYTFPPVFGLFIKKIYLIPNHYSIGLSFSCLQMSAEVWTTTQHCAQKQTNLLVKEAQTKQQINHVDKLQKCPRL